MPLYAASPSTQMPPDIFGQQAPAPASVSQPSLQNNYGMAAPAQTPGMDLMGMGLNAPAPAPMMPPAPMPMMAPAPAPMPMMAPAPAPSPTILAFNKEGLCINFELSKPNGPGPDTKVVAVFENQTSTPMSNLHFQAAVPKFLKLKLSAPSSTNIPPNSSSKVEQVMEVNNTMQGQKTIAMKIKLAYSVNGQQKNELFTVSNFPANY